MQCEETVYLNTTVVYQGFFLSSINIYSKTLKSKRGTETLTSQ